MLGLESAGLVLCRYCPAKQENHCNKFLVQQHGSVKRYHVLDVSHVKLTVSEFFICAGRLPFSSWIADLISSIS